MTNSTPNQTNPKSATNAVPLGAASPGKSGTSGNTSEQKTQMLNDEIKKSWNKLSDDDVELYAAQPERFFTRLQEAHGVTKDNAVKRITELKATCGCGTEKAA